MKNKILKQVYISKVEVEEFSKGIEMVITALNGSNKVDFTTYLDNYQHEEVIVFEAAFYGETEEEMNQEYEKFKNLIKASFAEEPKEK